MSESNGKKNLLEFPTGAVRNKDGWGARYDLFSPIALEALAKVFGEGRDGPDAYPPWNWEKGLSVSFLVNRGLRHWFLYASGDRSEDHLAKCEWAFHCARHSEEAWPHLNQDMRRRVGDQLNVPPVVDDATAASWRLFSERMDALRRESREEALVERLEAMKADVKGAVMGITDPWEGKGGYMDGEGTIRFQTDPPRVPTRYLLVVSNDMNQESLNRFLDQLRDAGAYADACSGRSDFLDANLHACDVAVLFSWGRKEATETLARVRAHDRPIVAVGLGLDDFPRLGTAERWYPTFAAHAPKAYAPSSR